MVHRAAVAEVFITDTVREDEDRFLVAAQWPRDHALYYPDMNGLSDPLMFAETIRQSLVYLAHRYFDVPLTQRFIGGGMDFEITDTELLRSAGAPLALVLEVRWTWVEHRPPRRFGMRLDVVLTVGGQPCGRGSLQATAVNERAYGLLRRHGAQSDGASTTGRSAGPGREAGRPQAYQVGRLRAKDVVLESAGGQWSLCLDLDHAILFDHPTDHIPLMLMYEGFRQFGHFLHHGGDAERGHHPADSHPPAATRSLTAAAINCLAFGELDEPVGLVAREHRSPADPAVPSRLLVDAIQGTTLLATADMTWAVPRRSPAAAEFHALA
jgi:2-oxo-3-(phosphooxy)propyl 3-oxoalkanoate synthase